MTHKPPALLGHLKASHQLLGPVNRQLYIMRSMHQWGDEAKVKHLRLLEKALEESLDRVDWLLLHAQGDRRPVYGPPLWQVCEACNYEQHKCHFCGCDLSHAESAMTNGNNHPCYREYVEFRDEVVD